MRGSSCSLVFALLVTSSALVVSAQPAAAQDAAVRAKAREVLAAARDAIVHVKVALKTKMAVGENDMPGRDEQVDVVGTVIDPSGLAVVSDASLSASAGMMINICGGGTCEPIETKSEVVDVKMVVKGGREIAARIVLRDRDLDLAFVAPLEKGGRFASVPLEATKPLDVLDDVIVVGRMGRSLDRSASVALGRIAAIVQKPRTFFVCDIAGGTTSSVGAPVFDATGKAVGVLVQRRASAGEGSAESTPPVILPAGDVKDVAQQALAEAAKPVKEEKRAQPAPAASAGAPSQAPK